MGCVCERLDGQMGRWWMVDGWVGGWVGGWIGWYKRGGCHLSGDGAGVGTVVGREAEPSSLKSAVLENEKEL